MQQEADFCLYVKMMAARFVVFYIYFRATVFQGGEMTIGLQ
jgi:hypothetical protein